MASRLGGRWCMRSIETNSFEKIMDNENTFSADRPKYGMKATTLADAIIAELTNKKYSNWSVTNAVHEAVHQVCGSQPAAQSAGQEAVALTDAEILDIGERVFRAHECTLTYGAVLQFGQELRASMTAPVNGGERYAELEHEHFGDPDKRTGIYAERAADARQVGARYEVKHSPVEGIPFWAEVTFEQYEMYRLNGSPVRRIPVAAPCKGMNCGATDGISHSAECIAEHDAALTSPAKVGGDERLTDAAIKVIADRYSSFVSVGVYDETRYDCTEDFYNFCRELIRAALSADGGEDATQAARDVMAERERQVSVEGWVPAHDDEYQENELSRAAACYALGCGLRLSDGPVWPWDWTWWKPTTPRRNLVKAAALMLAEIERMDRATAKGA